MELDEFIKKVDWKKNQLVAGFASSLYELEKKEGRPVYYFEVLYYLNEKTKAGGLSEGLRRFLGDLHKRARKDSVGSVSVGEVLTKYNALLRYSGKGPQINNVAEFREVIGFAKKIDEFKEKIKETAEDWGSLRVKKVFPENDPLFYAKWKGVEKGTVFENIKIEKDTVGKTEKTVTYQFARWLAQKHKPITSYLELR